MKTAHPNAALLHSLGQALKATRRDTRTSLARLSDASGVAMSCISVIERGTSNPTLDTINRLAVAMGTTPSRILRYAEHLCPETATATKTT